MKNNINVKYMSRETLETLKKNLNRYELNFIESPKSSKWIHELTNEPTYITKKFVIEDFDLKLPQGEKDTETELENSIKLYNHLKGLPMYVLTDEQFWNWINFDKCYEVALRMMPVKKGSSVIKDHWLFTQGKRRGLFFGVLSRAYLRVHLTVDCNAEDPYELTKFVVEKPERFRNLSWRTFSSEKHIVRGALRAEKDIFDDYGEVEKTEYFTEIAKFISRLGSVALLDVMTEEDIYDKVYYKYKSMLELDSKNEEELIIA